MTKNAAGLSFQEAFDEAQGEEADTAANSSSTVIEERETLTAPEEEQPAVETEEKVGVFSDLTSEEAESEQPEEDSHEVTVNGETFKVSLSELTDGYQRHADYTRGTQEIAEEKKQHSKAITLWEALEGDYVGTVQKLMSRTGVKGQVAPEPKQDIEAIVKEQVEQRLASDPRLQQLENEVSLRQIEEIFTGIEKDFNIPTLTNEDKQIVLTKAQEWETTDLSYVVYRLLQQQQKATAVQKNVELVSTTQGRRSGTQEDFIPEDRHYATVADAWAASIAEEENSS
jgi:hypothetical protein